MAERAARRSQGPARVDEQPEASGDGKLDLLDIVELWPALARMGAMATLRAAGFATSATVAAGRRIASAARAGESPAELWGDAREQALAAARRALGVTDIEDTLGRVTSDPPSGPGSDAEHRLGLRERGEQLLAKSAQVNAEEAGHPAFGVVLEELAPDEVRILSVLATKGDQASVDVMAAGPLGVGSQLLSHRLTLVHRMAGCRHPALLQLYLDNLLRLGLIALTDDPLDDEEGYQVLEAQPEVIKATEDISRPKVVRRRITLTHFGRCFSEICVPLDEPAKRSKARAARRRPAANGGAA
jgi:hypothetical protein